MTDPDDPRDPRLRALLDVEALDDVTRARLVRTAADAASARRHPARLLGAVAAAVVAVVLVAGAVIVLTRPDRGPHPTALGPRHEDTTAGKAGAAPEAAEAPGADTGAALPALGSLGAVDSPEAIRRAVAATTPGAPAPVPACAVAAARALGTPVAAGRGTDGGAPVTVIVVERATGGRSAIVTADATCRSEAPVAL